MQVIDDPPTCVSLGLALMNLVKLLNSVGTLD